MARRLDIASLLSDPPPPPTPRTPAVVEAPQPEPAYAPYHFDHGEFVPTPQPILLAPHLRNPSRGGHPRDLQDNGERDSRQHPRPPNYNDAPARDPSLSPPTRPSAPTAHAGPRPVSRPVLGHPSPPRSTSRGHSVPFAIQPTPPLRRTPEPEAYPRHQPSLPGAAAASSPPTGPAMSSSYPSASSYQRSRPVSPETHFHSSASPTHTYRSTHPSALTSRAEPAHSPIHARATVPGSATRYPLSSQLSPRVANTSAPSSSNNAPATPATPFDALMAAVTIETERISKERRSTSSAAATLPLDSPALLPRSPLLARPVGPHDPVLPPAAPRSSLSPVHLTHRIPSYPSTERLLDFNIPTTSSSSSRQPKRPRSDSNRVEAEHVRGVSACSPPPPVPTRAHERWKEEEEDDGAEVFYAPMPAGHDNRHAYPRSRPGSKIVQGRMERTREGGVSEMHSTPDLKAPSPQHDMAVLTTPLPPIKKSRKKADTTLLNRAISLEVDRNTGPSEPLHPGTRSPPPREAPANGKKDESLSGSPRRAANDQLSVTDIDEFFLEHSKPIAPPIPPCPPPDTEPLHPPPRRPPRSTPTPIAFTSFKVEPEPSKRNLSPMGKVSSSATSLRVASHTTVEPKPSTLSPVVEQISPSLSRVDVAMVDDEVIAAVEAAHRFSDQGRHHKSFHDNATDRDVDLDVLMKEDVPEEEEEEEQLEEEEEELKSSDMVVDYRPDAVNATIDAMVVDASGVADHDLLHLPTTTGRSVPPASSPAPAAIDPDVEDELLSLVDDRRMPSVDATSTSLASRFEPKASKAGSALALTASSISRPVTPSFAHSPNTSMGASCLDRRSIPPLFASSAIGKDPSIKTSASAAKKEVTKPAKRSRPKASSSKVKSAKANVAAADPRESAALATPPPGTFGVGSTTSARSKKGTSKKGAAATLVAAAAVASNQRSRSTSAMPDIVVDGKDAVAEEQGTEDDKLYCICKTTYDEDRVMIACDRCDEWYHTSCLGMSDTEVDLVDQFFCPQCVATERSLNLKTTYKTRCHYGLQHPKPQSSEACHKSSRAPFSKYCSDECGIKCVQGRITAWSARGGDRDRLWETVKDAERRQGVVINQIQDRGDASDDVKVEDGASVAALGTSARLSSLACIKEQKKRQDQREIVRLQAQIEQLIAEREQRKKEMDVILWREKLVDLAAQRSDEVDECGWDTRLIYDEEEVGEFGGAVLVSYEAEADVDESWWCHGPKKCERHTGWAKLRVAEVVFEKEVKEQALGKLTQRERDIRRRMEDIVNPQAHVREIKAPLRVKVVPHLNGHAKTQHPNGDGVMKKGKKRKVAEST